MSPADRPAAPERERLHGMTGLLLAGGRSRRFGSDKALAAVAGRTLLARGIAALGACCAEVLVASGDGRRLDAALAETAHATATNVRLRQIADARHGAGPLAALVAGLRAAPSRLVAVLAVDLPWANADVLRALASSIGEADAAIPVVDGRRQPLHAVYRPGALPALEEALEAGRLALGAAMDHLDVALLGPPVWGHLDPQGRFAANVNTPEDLAALDADSP